MNNKKNIFDLIHDDDDIDYVMNYDDYKDDDIIMDTRTNTTFNSNISINLQDIDDVEMNNIDNKTNNKVDVNKVDVNKVDNVNKITKSKIVCDYEEYSFLSKIRIFNNLPEICNSCGKNKSDHKYLRHNFIQIKKNDRCVYCGCFFFEHSHSFMLDKLKTDFVKNHPYLKISTIHK